MLIRDDNLLALRLKKARINLQLAQEMVDYEDRAKLDGFIGAALLGVKAAQEELKGR